MSLLVICDFDGLMVMVMMLMTVMVMMLMTVMVMMVTAMMVMAMLGIAVDWMNCLWRPPPPIPCLSHLTPDSTFDNHHDFEERRLKREIVNPPLNRKKSNFFPFLDYLP